jgi:hypothetical protein
MFNLSPTKASTFIITFFNHVLLFIVYSHLELGHSSLKVVIVSSPIHTQFGVNILTKYQNLNGIIILLPMGRFFDTIVDVNY